MCVPDNETDEAGFDLVSNEAWIGPLQVVLARQSIDLFGQWTTVVLLVLALLVNLSLSGPYIVGGLGGLPGVAVLRFLLFFVLLDCLRTRRQARGWLGSSS